MIYKHGVESRNSTRAAQPCRFFSSCCLVIEIDYIAGTIEEQSASCIAAVASSTVALAAVIYTDSNKIKVNFPGKFDRTPKSLIGWLFSIKQY